VSFLFHPHSPLIKTKQILSRNKNKKTEKPHPLGKLKRKKKENFVLMSCLSFSPEPEIRNGLKKQKKNSNIFCLDIVEPMLHQSQYMYIISGISHQPQKNLFQENKKKFITTNSQTKFKKNENIIKRDDDDDFDLYTFLQSVRPIYMQYK
jgi:hypothetical protein